MASTQGAAAKRVSQDRDFELALARTIKVLRAELGIERKELARLSGLSYPYISELEQGKKRPSAESLAAISRALRVRQSELLDRTEKWVERRHSDDEFLASSAGKHRSPRGRTYGRLYRLAPASTAISTDELQELATRAAQLGADDFHRVLDLVRRLTR